MNEIARRALGQNLYTEEERMQLAQLIGYSFDGYSTLSYVSDESCYEAQDCIKQYISF